MKTLTIVARVLLGLIFVLFGINAFYPFLPLPSIEGDGGKFIGLLAASHYLHAIKIVEIAGGVILLSGRFVPLGLTLLGPVIVNIILFHLFLAPSGLPVGIVVAGLEVFLIARYWSAFKGILRP